MKPKSKRVVIEHSGFGKYVLGTLKDGASRVSSYMSLQQAEAVAAKIPGAGAFRARAGGSYFVEVPEGYKP